MAQTKIETKDRADRRALRGATALRGLDLITANGRQCYGLAPSNLQANALTDGVVTSGMSRTYMTILKTATDVRLVYNNYGFDDVAPNAIVVKAALEGVGPTGAAEFIPAYFAGARSVTIEPGGIAISDPIPVTLAANAVGIYARTYVSVTAGGKWPKLRYHYFTTLAESTTFGAPATDQTDASGQLAGGASNIYAYAPIGLIAKADQAWGFGWGDSVTAGSGDDTAGNNFGWVERALAAAGIPVINLSRSGELASDVSAANSPKRRTKTVLAASAKFGICSYGINDMAGGLAPTQVSLINHWNLGAARGVPQWQYTLPPRTTSTDSFATSTNQTVLSYEANRVALNDWIRDGAPILNGAAVATGSNATGTLRAGSSGHPLTGYVDTADTVEVNSAGSFTRNGGRWKATWTTDGTHPSAAAHAAMAAALTALLPTILAKVGS